MASHRTVAADDTLGKGGRVACRRRALGPHVGHAGRMQHRETRQTHGLTHRSGCNIRTHTHTHTYARDNIYIHFRTPAPNALLDVIQATGDGGTRLHVSHARVCSGNIMLPNECISHQTHELTHTRTRAHMFVRKLTLGHVCVCVF